MPHGNGAAGRMPLSCCHLELEDIVVPCETSAHDRRRTGATRGLEITPEILEKSIGRVIVNLASPAATCGRRS